MNITAKVNIKDYSSEVKHAMRQQVEIALKSIGQTAEGHAKDECPVDTGNLRNSIANEHDDSTVYVGTNVEYAPYVEYGDYNHTTGKKHFLRDSIANHGDEYKSILKAALDT